MNDTILGALIGAAATVVAGILGTWLTSRLDSDWQTAIDVALEFVENRQLRGNEVEYRNCQSKALGRRLSIMADVYGPQRGVYLILINRKGRILNIRRLNGWNPLSRKGRGTGGVAARRR